MKNDNFRFKNCDLQEIHIKIIRKLGIREEKVYS